MFQRPTSPTQNEKAEETEKIEALESRLVGNGVASHAVWALQCAVGCLLAAVRSVRDSNMSHAWHLLFLSYFNSAYPALSGCCRSQRI
jgi:predicted branched-subunit amino acid permease